MSNATPSLAPVPNLAYDGPVLRARDLHKTFRQGQLNVTVLNGASLDAPSYVIEAPADGEGEEVTEFNPVIIAEAVTSLKRLSVSEAVMELDLTGAPVLVFQHGGSGRVNVIYRRADGNVGWVDPPATGEAVRH